MVLHLSTRSPTTLNLDCWTAITCPLVCVVSSLYGTDWDDTHNGSDEAAGWKDRRESNTLISHAFDGRIWWRVRTRNQIVCWGKFEEWTRSLMWMLGEIYGISIMIVISQYNYTENQNRWDLFVYLFCLLLALSSSFIVVLSYSNPACLNVHIVLVLIQFLPLQILFRWNTIML